MQLIVGSELTLPFPRLGGRPCLRRCVALLMLHLSAACYQPRWALKLVMRVCIFLGAMLVLVFLCMLDLTCVPVSVLGGKSGHRLYKQSKR